jgi:hypothetical protein
MMFEAQAGNLVDIKSDDIVKLFEYWKKLLRTTGGEI